MKEIELSAYCARLHVQASKGIKTENELERTEERTKPRESITASTIPAVNDEQLS